MNYDGMTNGSDERERVTEGSREGQRQGARQGARQGGWGRERELTTKAVELSK